MKDREKIPDDLAAVVLYENNRTCCVCRENDLNVQIHHIDQNPANNTRENLTVVCLNCHSKIHSQIAFGRNYSAELVKLYSDSWVRICTAKLDGKIEKEPGDIELANEVQLEISLSLHYWKNIIMSQYPEIFNRQGGPTYSSIWEMISSELKIRNLVEEIKRIEIIMNDGLVSSIKQIDLLMSTYENSIPNPIKILWLRVRRQIGVERDVYRMKNMFGLDERGMATFIEARLKGISKWMGQFDKELNVGSPTSREPILIKAPPGASVQ